MHTLYLCNFKVDFAVSDIKDWLILKPYNGTNSVFRSVRPVFRTLLFLVIHVITAQSYFYLCVSLVSVPPSPHNWSRFEHRPLHLQGTTVIKFLKMWHVKMLLMPGCNKFKVKWKVKCLLAGFASCRPELFVRPQSQSLRSYQWEGHSDNQ